MTDLQQQQQIYERTHVAVSRGAMVNTPTAREESEVLRESSKLHMRLDDLGSTLGRLIDRLTPVCHPESSTAELSVGACAPEEALCEVAGSFRHARNSVDQRICQVERLLGRLGL